jgi:hypothetical protein
MRTDILTLPQWESYLTWQLATLGRRRVRGRLVGRVRLSYHCSVCIVRVSVYE